MQVTLKDTFCVDAPRKIVWDLLSDPHSIVPCLRGAKITEQTGERTYKGAVTMKVGPVSAGFRGDIIITTLDADAGAIALTGEGQGTKGRGKASMSVAGALSDLSESQTQVDFTMTLGISGKLAQFGSRLIGDVAKRVLKQFVDCFSLRVQKAVESAAAES